MIPTTAGRAPSQTDESVNRRIREATERRLRYFVAHPDEIPARLRELDSEWDIDRALQANASTLALAGIVFGSTMDRRWFALPAAATAFLLQHAVQGWCPPLPVLRRLGFRTGREIERERHALLAIRDDPGDPPAKMGGAAVSAALTTGAPLLG